MNTVLKRPLITEKAMDGTKRNYYSFLVDGDANKHQIKEAIETIFKVDVLTVRTVTLKGKTKRVGKMRRPAQTSSIKKAFIRIKKDQTIDVVPTAPEGEKS